MNAQVTAAMTATEFREWRARMGWSQSQAAHVLMVSPTSIAAYENGRTPVDGHVAHLCDSAELLRTLKAGTFFGNALDVIHTHHAKLQKRMDEADQMPGRGRQPKTQQEEVMEEIADANFDQLKRAGIITGDEQT